jgi:hypothetical protein
VDAGYVWEGGKRLGTIPIKEVEPFRSLNYSTNYISYPTHAVVI